ncbi:hypothetical protein ESCO_001202 [Escovopsis weberi]|uniref:Uncharacterized protein n=1 Tax=Escovopsis weberi TaxID=150374 RepID=A0A0M9VTI7_ESCWE|nr:hypothetical protein ESCO_001202 [Escovopsis weberi]
MFWSRVSAAFSFFSDITVNITIPINIAFTITKSIDVVFGAEGGGLFYRWSMTGGEVNGSRAHSWLQNSLSVILVWNP